MPILVSAPTIIPAVGTPPKRIEEFIGRVHTGDDAISIARMHSPRGWSEPGQRPAFTEYTLVLSGRLRVEHETGGDPLEVGPGQAVICRPGEWVRYSTPEADTTYVAVCVPAFSPDTVQRDDDTPPGER